MFNPNEIIQSFVAAAASAKDVPNNVVGLYIATSGTLTLVNRDGTQVSFATVPAGFIPIKFKSIVACPAGTVLLLGPGK